MPKGKEKEAISKWTKAFTPDAHWEKSDLLDVVHWGRQVVGLLCGIIWGLIPLQGAAGITSFLILNVVILFLYYTKYLGIDDEDVGRWDLVSEGFFTSFALFLVVWITVYNGVHVP